MIHVQERRVVGRHGERLNVVLASAHEADRAPERGVEQIEPLADQIERGRDDEGAAPLVVDGEQGHVALARARRENDHAPAAVSAPRGERLGLIGPWDRDGRERRRRARCNAARRRRRGSSRRRARAPRPRTRRPGRGGSACAGPRRRPVAASTPSGQPRTSSVPDMKESETTAGWLAPSASPLRGVASFSRRFFSRATGRCHAADMR